MSKSKKMDSKLVAAKQSKEGEVVYIAKHYKIPITVVRRVMILTGNNGKPARSRTVIYAGLRALGYVIKTRYIK